jgi:hypothetical protein
LEYLLCSIDAGEVLRLAHWSGSTWLLVGINPKLAPNAVGWEAMAN